MSRLIQQARLLLTESRYRLPAIFVGFYMAVWLLTRLGLLIFQHALARNGVGRVLEALAVGEVFDLVSALWLAAPLVLFLTVLPERWFRWRATRGFLYLWMAVAAVLRAVRGRGRVFLLRGVRRPLQLRGGGLPDLSHRGGGQHLGELPHRDHPHRHRHRHGGAALRCCARPMRAAWERRAPRLQRLAFLASTRRCSPWPPLLISPALARVSDDRALNELAGNGYYSFFMAFWAPTPPTTGCTRPGRSPPTWPRLHRLLAEPAAPPAAFAPDSTLRPVLDAPGPTAERGDRARGEPRLRVHRRAESGQRQAEPDAAVRRHRRGGHAAHPRVLHRQPDDPGARGDDLVAAAAAGHLDRAARPNRWTCSPSPSCCGAPRATRRCSSTAAGRSSTAWAST